MQNSAVNSFPWVNPANFTSNSSNSSKSQWQNLNDYQNLNLAADLFLKKNHQNIYSPSTISQLAAHSNYLEKNYLEKMSNLTATVNSNEMQSSLSAASNQLHSQAQLPDLNNKCPHHPSKDRLKFSCEICIQEYSLNLNNSKDSLKNMQGNSSSFSNQLSTSNSTNHLAMLSNSSGLQNSNSKSTMDNLQNSSSSSFSNQNNGNTTPVSSGSGSGRKCLNKGNFLCVVCNKSFTQKGNLKTHQLIHTGQKPFVCNVCGKAFTQKGNVDTHMKIHTGQKKTRKSKQKDNNESVGNNKERFVKNDFKTTQRNKNDLNNSTNLTNSSNQQDSVLNMNQNQSVMDRLQQELLPMHSSLINESIKSNHHQLNNGHSPINFSNTTSTQNWSNLTNNLINNSSSNHHNNKSFDNFANLAGYNSFTQQQMNLLLNQSNGKHSPIQNLSSMQQQQQLDLNQISNNYNGF